MRPDAVAERVLMTPAKTTLLTHVRTKIFFHEGQKRTLDGTIVRKSEHFPRDGPVGGAPSPVSTKICG
jgi:hypothetical protein